MRSCDGPHGESGFAHTLFVGDDKRYSKNQIEFVNLIINELTDRGVVEATRIYEAPYIGVAPEGPEEIFVDADLNKIFDAIKQLADIGA